MNLAPLIRRILGHPEIERERTAARQDLEPILTESARLNRIGRIAAERATRQRRHDPRNPIEDTVLGRSQPRRAQ